MSLEAVAAAAERQWAGRTIAGMDLPTVMTAIAGSESGWNPEAGGDTPRRLRQLGLYGPAATAERANCPLGDPDGPSSIGIWQIHMPAHHTYLRQVTGSDNPCTWAAWLRVPAHNARATDAVIGATGQRLPLSALRPWTVWFSLTGNPNDDAGDGNGSWRAYAQQAQAAISKLRAAGPPPAAVPLATAAPPGQPTLWVWGLVAAGAAGAGLWLLSRPRA